MYVVNTFALSSLHCTLLNKACSNPFQMKLSTEMVIRQKSPRLGPPLLMAKGIIAFHFLWTFPLEAVSIWLPKLSCNSPKMFQCGDLFLIFWSIKLICELSTCYKLSSTLAFHLIRLADAETLILLGPHILSHTQRIHLSLVTFHL